MTQEQLAEQLEVSRQAVSKWESGQSYPEMEKLFIICDMFHCDMDSLVKGRFNAGGPGGCGIRPLYERILLSNHRRHNSDSGGGHADGVFWMGSFMRIFWQSF